METNRLRLMIRGHECVKEGCSERFGGKLLTVFSASNYCGTSGNKAAVLVMDPGSSVVIKTFPPLPLFARAVPVSKEKPSLDKTPPLVKLTKQVTVPKPNEPPKTGSLRKMDGLLHPHGGRGGDARELERSPGLRDKRAQPSRRGRAGVL
jgi:hypothetical protein